ncbi:hypothetical protein WBP07_02930 [Novosphingobium sp. BL-8A]
MVLQQKPRNSGRIRIGWLAIALCLVAFIGWFCRMTMAISHDKSINSDLQRLWDNPQGLPLGVAVPANNRWMPNAFVADRSSGEFRKVSLLILDDHYRSTDPAYLSENGVIGGVISGNVLCSIPVQSLRNNIELDPAVRKLIEAECPNTR